MATDTSSKSWVQKTPGVSGGDACVRNTRITVHGLVHYRQEAAGNAQLFVSRDCHETGPMRRQRDTNPTRTEGAHERTLNEPNPSTPNPSTESLESLTKRPLAPSGQRGQPPRCAPDSMSSSRTISHGDSAKQASPPRRIGKVAEWVTGRK
jgi:hypothetical protein